MLLVDVLMVPEYFVYHVSHVSYVYCCKIQLTHSDNIDKGNLLNIFECQIDIITCMVYFKIIALASTCVTFLSWVTCNMGKAKN